MKTDFRTLSEMAYGRLFQLMEEGGLQMQTCEPEVIAEAELCLAIMKAVSMRQRRLQIDISYPKEPE